MNKIHITKFMRDITGVRSGCLVALYPVNREAVTNKIIWLCRCDCGSEFLIRSVGISKGHTKSCGCLQRAKPNRKTHGMSKTAEYRVWRTLKYFAKDGARVDPEWARSFERFFADMGKRPSASHSLLRKDKNKGYDLSNCYWATERQQRGAMKNNKLLTLNGVTKCVSWWCRKKKLASSTLRNRVGVLGWSDEKAIMATPREKSDVVDGRKRYSKRAVREKMEG